MLDLPDHGYVSNRVTLLDPGGVVEASLSGDSDILNRPGVKYSVQFSLPMLRSSDEARIFQSLLEQGAMQDVSYPFPLDRKSPSAGVPRVNGASPTGAVIPIDGLSPGYSFRQGQAIAVISGGVGFVHKISAPTVASVGGAVIVPVFPWTRRAFLDNDVVEIERPRIRGVLQWDGADQGYFGRRGFTFTITERR